MKLVDHVGHSAKDYFHFGITFLGILVGIAGVVTITKAAFIAGGILVAMGLAYFLVHIRALD
jgi:hypothetical protein